MEINFDHELKAQNSIDIPEISDFALEAINGDGYYYYLIIKTFLGTSVIASCGPVVPDIDALPNGFQISVNKMQYRDDKMIKNIYMWLNDKTKKITNAYLIDVNEAINNFREIKEYLHNLSEETF